MQKIFVVLYLAALCLFMSGCGYRWQPEYPNGVRPTVEVPFISGDEDGSLTSEVIRALSCSGLATFRYKEAEYRLVIAVLGDEVETVGYRRDRQKINGKIQKNLLACEGRKTIRAEAVLYEGDSEKIAYGPYRVSADADYDYVDGDSLQDLSFVGPEGNLITILPFSLGQLESVEAAQEASRRPLYGKLAQKIVDVISSEW